MSPVGRRSARATGGFGADLHVSKVEGSERQRHGYLPMIRGPGGYISLGCVHPWMGGPSINHLLTELPSSSVLSRSTVAIRGSFGRCLSHSCHAQYMHTSHTYNNTPHTHTYIFGGGPQSVSCSLPSPSLSLSRRDS